MCFGRIFVDEFDEEYHCGRFDMLVLVYYQTIVVDYLLATVATFGSIVVTNIRQLTE